MSASFINQFLHPQFVKLLSFILKDAILLIMIQTFCKIITKMGGPPKRFLQAR